MAEVPAKINYDQLAASLLNIFRNHGKHLRIRLNEQIEYDVGACLSLEVFSIATKATICQVITEFPFPQNTHIRVDASAMTTGDYKDAERCLSGAYNHVLATMPFTFEPPSPADLELALLGLPATKISTCCFSLMVKIGRFQSETEGCQLRDIYPAAILGQLTDVNTEKPHEIKWREFL